MRRAASNANERRFGLTLKLVQAGADFTVFHLARQVVTLNLPVRIRHVILANVERFAVENDHPPVKWRRQELLRNKQVGPQVTSFCNGEDIFLHI